MFYLFSTTPVDQGNNKNKKSSSVAQNKGRTSMTWFLIFVWVCLISFGIASVLDPEWLEKYSRPGIEGESLDYKNFGDNYLVNGNYKMAITNYKRALEINPEFPDVVVNMGIAFIRLGRTNKGVQNLIKALKMKDSNKGVINFTLGDVLEKQGKYDDAISYYLKAINTGVEEFQIYKQVGLVYYKKEDFEKALENYELALMKKNDVTLYYRMMLENTLKNYKNYEENTKILKNLIANEITLNDLQIYDLEIIKYQIHLDPEIANIHNKLGSTYEILGDSIKALEHFKNSLQIWPNNKIAVENLKRLQTQTK